MCVRPTATESLPPQSPPSNVHAIVWTCCCGDVNRAPKYASRSPDSRTCSTEYAMLMHLTHDTMEQRLRQPAASGAERGALVTLTSR